MKTIKLILLSLTIVSLGAQELDQEFLDSLPDDIAKDLEDRNSLQELNSQETYRPYLYSSKLRQSEEFLKLKDRLEQDLQELERRLKTGENLNANKDLVLYGSDFFNTFQTSFMPINEPNPDSGYALDVGDVLQIQLVGQNDYIEEFPINSDARLRLQRR